jgi:hypothetical protein
MKLLIAFFACGALSIALFAVVRWMEQGNDRSRDQLFSMMMGGR